MSTTTLDPEPWIDDFTSARFSQQNKLTEGYAFEPRAELGYSTDPGNYTPKEGTP